MEKKMIIAGKKLTQSMAKKLDEALTKGNMEQVKKLMEKLFTFKNICNMHDNHIIELGECIIDLWRSEDQIRWAQETEGYIKLRITRYQKKRQDIFHDVEWSKATHNGNKVEMLDKTYQLWVYEQGFEFSRFQMFRMLYRITQNILQHEGKDKP